MSAKRASESESHDNGVAETVILHFDYIYRCPTGKLMMTATLVWLAITENIIG